MSDSLSEKVVFGGRFELIEELGRGSQGITYLARELGTERRVAVKKLAVRESPDWKSIELFEREGLVLKSMSHPGIPQYIDAFHEVEDGSERERFVLVQEYVSGENLGELIEQGLRMDEAGTRDFLEQMLEILAYLHALEPPVIHRDIKPSNIMRRSNGRWVLIDFGGAQVVASEQEANICASTVVGTSGYMPFEQLMGRTVVASDLYSLGATVVHLLSHRHPSDLLVDDEANMSLLFQEFVTTSPTILGLLEGMLEPLWEERIQSAQLVLDILGGDAGIAQSALVVEPSLVKRHRDIQFSALEIQEMQVVTETSEELLRFEIMRRGSAARAWEMEEHFVAMIALLIIVLVTMRAFYLYVAPSMGLAFTFGVSGSLMSAALYRRWQRGKHCLYVTASEVRISKGVLGLMKRSIALDRIHNVYTVPKRGLRDKELGYVVEFELDGGDKIVRYGTGQTFSECEWMAGKIRKKIDGFRE